MRSRSVVLAVPLLLAPGVVALLSGGYSDVARLRAGDRRVAAARGGGDRAAAAAAALAARGRRRSARAGRADRVDRRCR